MPATKRRTGPGRSGGGGGSTLPRTEHLMGAAASSHSSPPHNANYTLGEAASQLQTLKMMVSGGGSRCTPARAPWKLVAGEPWALGPGGRACAERTHAGSACAEAPTSQAGAKGAADTPGLQETLPEASERGVCSQKQQAGRQKCRRGFSGVRLTGDRVPFC